MNLFEAMRRQAKLWRGESGGLGLIGTMDGQAKKRYALGSPKRYRQIDDLPLGEQVVLAREQAALRP